MGYGVLIPVETPSFEGILILIIGCFVVMFLKQLAKGSDETQTSYEPPNGKGKRDDDPIMIRIGDIYFVTTHSTGTPSGMYNKSGNLLGYTDNSNGFDLPEVWQQMQETEQMQEIVGHTRTHDGMLFYRTSDGHLDIPPDCDLMKYLQDV